MRDDPGLTQRLDAGELVASRSGPLAHERKLTLDLARRLDSLTRLGGGHGVTPNFARGIALSPQTASSIHGRPKLCVTRLSDL